MKNFILFFVVLIFVIFVGCSNGEDVVLIEEVSEEEGIIFILSVLEGSEEDLSITPVLIIDGKVIFASKIQDHINEISEDMDVFDYVEFCNYDFFYESNFFKYDEDVIRGAIERTTRFEGTIKYFDEIGITVTEIEVDEKMNEYFEDVDRTGIRIARSEERIREHFSYTLRRDKMFDAFFDQYVEEITETEIVALYQEKLELVPGFPFPEYGEYRESLVRELTEKRILQATSDRLQEAIESLEIIYFKE